ncbi:RNA-binding protein 28-like, partial [Saccoglossus kowalevskii]|uniref:RNA-binding protein 28-like n=1 Tax=Saccoglossus kowalevskii TaxID=10224 RepID=A0ABM0GK94_SACKO
NIPFDAQEEDVTELFGKHGKVNYCKLVIDPSTEHSRGCAFVKFRSSTEAEKCLEKNSNEDGVNGFMLNGRKLHLSMALSKEEAEKLKKDKKEPKEKKDKRNLYLAREGMIRPGTKAAEGVSKGDMMKRFKMEKVKRQKLQNLNIFVSPTRLSVHNLPTSVDNKKLRELFWKAAGDDKAKIIEARVMRDMGRVNSRGVPKSLGYAFIEFTEHEHALKALRHVNNNPEIYEPIKRPIVEFSLENKLALQVKERRKQKVSAKLNEEGASGKKPMITKTKFETAAKIMDGTKEKVRKGMPSHMGPKVRWRDRKNKLPVAKKPKDKMSREKSRGMKMNSDARVVQPMKVKTKKKSGKRKGAPGDDFDRMVQNYQKSKLSRTRQTKKVKKTKSKWFE